MGILKELAITILGPILAQLIKQLCDYLLSKLNKERHYHETQKNGTKKEQETICSDIKQDKQDER